MAGNGVTSAGQRQIRNGNKRLAIFGEFVLGLVMGQEWYHSGTDESESYRSWQCQYFSPWADIEDQLFGTRSVRM
jgi:hypothetical protein